MENLGDLLRARQPAAKPKVHTREQALADEIWEWCGRKLAFPRIMAIIKRLGPDETYRHYNDVRKGKCTNPLALFIWKTKTKTNGTK